MIEVNSNFNGNPVGFKFNFDDKENIDEILKNINLMKMNMIFAKCAKS